MRSALISEMRAGAPWDLLVIGGGATGLGVALEASSRGYKTLLLEQHDLCKATSSRSTKLIHGGVRYLEQGNFRLVADALRERGRLLRNAPGLVRPLPLIIPAYRWWEKGYYGAGLKFYDLLAGRRKIAPSRLLSRREALERLPTLRTEHLRGAALFWDASFDDARLGIALAVAAARRGGILLNYFKVLSLLKIGGKVAGVLAQDVLSGRQHEIEARAVINCGGVFSDQIRHLDGAPNRLIQASRGSHVVLDRSFLPGEHALLIPRTSDRRILFAIPWHNRVLAGTTDVPVTRAELEPHPEPQEIDFILSHLGRYLTRQPAGSDILSAFAGLRPLLRSSRPGGGTASLSRDHRIVVSASGLLSVMGGKWTTYRKMGEEAVDRAVPIARLPAARSVTAALRIEETGAEGNGSGDSFSLSALRREDRSLAQPIHECCSCTRAEVVRAVRREWACTVEDVLARRTRLLFLDARASLEAAPEVAALMAAELGQDEAWQAGQVAAFEELARSYLPGSNRSDSDTS